MTNRVQARNGQGPLQFAPLPVTSLLAPAESCAADTRLELAVGIVEMIGNLAGDTPLPGRQVMTPLLGRIAEAVPETGGVSLVSRATRRKAPLTIAATEQWALEFDQLQIRLNQGPCLDSLGAAELIQVDDLAGDPRWPALAGTEQPLGIRSILSVPVYTCDGVGQSLNLYAESPHAYDPGQHSIAYLCAAALGLACSALHEHERADNLRIALGTNRQIGTAIGILMARYRCTPDEAFTALRVTSQHQHRKLRDIADEVIYTGGLPGRTSRRSRD